MIESDDITKINLYGNLLKYLRYCNHGSIDTMCEVLGMSEDRYKDLENNIEFPTETEIFLLSNMISIPEDKIKYFSFHELHSKMSFAERFRYNCFKFLSKCMNTYCKYSKDRL